VRCRSRTARITWTANTCAERPRKRKRRREREEEKERERERERKREGETGKQEDVILATRDTRYGAFRIKTDGNDENGGETGARLTRSDDKVVISQARAYLIKITLQLFAGRARGAGS